MPFSSSCRDSIHLFTDGSYTIQADEEAPAVARPHSAWRARGRLRRIPALSVPRVPTEALRVAFEAASLNVAEWTRLRKAAGRAYSMEIDHQPGRSACAR